MKIHVTQRHGIRYFTRFADLAERDKLTLELRIEDKDNQTVTIDLTTALIEEYSKHPEIGKLSPDAGVQVVGLRPLAPLVARQSKTVSPAYLADSNEKKDDIVTKVREAQFKAAEERKARQAEIAAARAERLAAARAVKHLKAESGKRKVESGGRRAESARPKATAAKLTKPKAAAKPAPKAPPTKSAGLTKTQQTAIKKIGAALAKPPTKPAAKPSQKPTKPGQRDPQP